MTDTPAADEAVTELVLDPGSFTGPERREVQHRLKVPYGELLDYTHEALRRALSATPPPEPQPVLSVDGTPIFPDEVLQVMVWVQSRRTNPDAQLEDFDNLTLRQLNGAHLRGLRPKALTSGSSTTSPTESPSAESSPA